MREPRARIRLGSGRRPTPAAASGVARRACCGRPVGCLSQRFGSRSIGRDGLAFQMGRALQRRSSRVPRPPGLDLKSIPENEMVPPMTSPMVRGPLETISGETAANRVPQVVTSFKWCPAHQAKR
eukprot:scaffold4358_cov137-Isochrysis_galbana.AAC.4